MLHSNGKSQKVVSWTKDGRDYTTCKIDHPQCGATMNQPIRLRQQRDTLSIRWNRTPVGALIAWTSVDSSIQASKSYRVHGTPVTGTIGTVSGALTKVTDGRMTEEKTPPTSPSMKRWPLSYHPNDGLSKYGGDRDLVGYGAKPPRPKWPRGAKVALNFCVHYEEGSEYSVLHGDGKSRNSTFEGTWGVLPDFEMWQNTHKKQCLSPVPYSPVKEDAEYARHVASESKCEYGARVGFWRLHRLFAKRKLPVTLFATGMALERNPAVCQTLKEMTQWEVASSGYRSIDYTNVKEDVEEEHMKRALAVHDRLLGKRPVGFGMDKFGPQTRKLVLQEGGFKYDSLSFSDDLPYWTLNYGSHPHLIIPGTASACDVLFAEKGTGEELVKHLKATLRFMVEEGRSGFPKMLTVSLHCRHAHAGLVAGLVEFLDSVKGYGRDVWVCTREQIADFWHENQFPIGAGKLPETASSGDDSDFETQGEEKPVDLVNVNLS